MEIIMKHLALTENHLFSKAYKGGDRYLGRYICVFVLKDKNAFRLMKANPEKKYLNRVGVTASKKVGGAVVRSRARRIMRAAYAQLEREGVRSGFIVVISAREGIEVCKSQDIYRELRRAFAKLGMLPVTQQ